MVPEFAILGHPNEGKSSVLSTLTEDDSVRISPLPGETKACRTFPVAIDSEEIIRFTDTPGFQNPHRLLYDLKQLPNPTIEDIAEFVRKHDRDEELHDDCELLKPVLRGAGIIYVVDGSRPVRKVDLAEMEILRLTGKPRMAILNCKNNEHQHLDEWKTEFRKHFNSSRIFNAHRANYIERINLLEALKSIEQDWQQPLEYVVSSFKQDWDERNRRTSELILEMIINCLRYTADTSISESGDIEKNRGKIFVRYTNHLKKQEKDCQEKIRKLFKHNIFNYSLPEQSILHRDLFSKETWEFLGLRKKQLAIAGGAGGAIIAAGLDIAAGGASLGLFTSLGGVIGAVGAVYGGKTFADKTKVLGLGGGRVRITVGPIKNSQFAFILLDRAFLYYSHIINWAHGRRDYPQTSIAGTHSFTQNMDNRTIRQINSCFSKAAQSQTEIHTVKTDCLESIKEQLHAISNLETPL